MLPKGEEPEASVRTKGSGWGGGPAPCSVNKSPNFSKSQFSRLPNVGPQLAEGSKGDVAAQHNSTHVDCCVNPLSQGFGGCFSRV